MLPSSRSPPYLHLSERRAALAACLGGACRILRLMVTVPNSSLAYSPDTTHLFFSYATFLLAKVSSFLSSSYSPLLYPTRMALPSRLLPADAPPPPLVSSPSCSAPAYSRSSSSTQPQSQPSSRSSVRQPRSSKAQPSTRHTPSRSTQAFSGQSSTTTALARRLSPRSTRTLRTLPSFQRAAVMLNLKTALAGKTQRVCLARCPSEANKTTTTTCLRRSCPGRRHRSRRGKSTSPLRSSCSTGSTTEGGTTAGWRRRCGGRRWTRACSRSCSTFGPREAGGGNREGRSSCWSLPLIRIGRRSR